MSLIRRTQIESILGAVSVNNSTTTPLSSGGVFFGEFEDISLYKAVGIMVNASHASAEDGLQAIFSSDGVNYDFIQPFTISSSDAVFYQLPVIAKYFLLSYTNGYSNLSYLRLQTIYHPTATIDEKSRIIDDINPQSNVVLNKSVIAGQNVDGDFETVGVNKEGRLKVSTIDTDEGNEFTFIRNTTYAPGEVLKFLTIVPSGSIYQAHYNFEIYTSDAFTAEFWELTAPSGVVHPGFQLPVSNRDRNYSDACDLQIYVYPTLAASGSVLSSYGRGAGGGVITTSIGNKPGEIILKNGNYYISKFKNNSAGTITVSSISDFKMVLR